MDHQKFIDSTYGSYSGFLSSNSNSSSYSMSLSDSEFPEEPPSTSGCSSDFPNSTTQKEKRKEKLKQYLKQLKQIVAPEAEVGTHVSTIGALKHVIISMQKSKEELKNESEKCISICTPFTSSSESDGDAYILSQRNQDDFQILVNVKGLKIMQVSPSLKKILGYPMESWTGRELTSFVHRKDVVTVNSSYGYEDHDKLDSQAIKYDEDGNATSELPKKVIYCRFRHYKALNHSYNLENRDQYTSFQLTVRPRKVDDDNSRDRQKQYLLLECRPLTSAYKNWAELPADKKVFSTRHSLFCSYTYIHPNAISLLGFLPQDMVGMSIFDFYHPQDFEQLYSIYKQVVNLKGTTICSPKIRLRTHNGDWIYVKTEWSSFINPWSKRLEFIIGQHTVIKGPHKIDIFSQPQSHECIAEEPEQYNKNLRMIRKLLLQPVVDEARSVALNIEDEPTEADMSVAPSQEAVNEQPQNAETTEDAKKKFKQTVSGIQPCGQILDDNSSGTYEQLNYTNNIKRFLMSQPKTYSSSSDKRSGNESYTDDSNAIDSDEVPDFEVDIPYPKPPSFCSSTKVLVSEKEDMMVPSPSCQTEEIGEETLREAQVAPPAEETPNVVMSLTQETLQEHTKRQEKMYLEQAKQDSNLVLLNMSSKYSIMQESSQGMKRGHSPDLEDVQNYKSFKSGELQVLHPPFPISTAESEVVPKEGSAPKMSFPDMYSLGITKSTATALYHNGGLPVVQIIPQNIQDVPKTVPTTKSDNVQWPYYPQSGLSFYPQVMGGFYQPVTLYSYPLPIWASTVTKGLRPSIPQAIFTQAGDKGKTMSASDTSSGDTGSSLMYLLEQTSSETNQAKGKPRVPARQRHLDPPWLFGVLWIEGIQMRYTVPRRKFNRIMKEDRDALNLMTQSDVVLKQMDEFEEELQKPDRERTEDEEADYLFMIEPDVLRDDSSSDLSEKLECSIKFEYDETDADQAKQSNSESMSVEAAPKSASGEDMSLSGSQDFSSDQMDETEKKSDSDSKSGYNDSSVDMESMCSKSSDLTPSDARSTDDKGSSMKESDSQSAKMSEGNKDSESENDLNQPKAQPNKFGTYFIKNPTKFHHSKKGFWLDETDMNEHITMQYRVKNSNDILLDDLNRLNEMNQSAVVHNQLSCLLDDLKPANECKEKCSCSSTSETAKDSQLCFKCTQQKEANWFGENFFEKLFMQPLFKEQEEEDSKPQRDSPDMEDLCDIIDCVD